MMTTSDCRTLNIYRVPIYQKRTPVLNKSLPSPHTRSPSPSRATLASGRRHSTPPAATRHLVHVHPSASPTVMKYFCSQSRITTRNNEQNILPNESNQFSSQQSISLVKHRQQDERLIRVVTTPTSVKSFTDIILPIAKKNRNHIVETTCNSNPSDIQSNNRNLRGPTNTINLDSEICISNEDSDDLSSPENISKIKSVRWCDARCPYRFVHCNLCHWYCSCPFCCWVACFLLLLKIGQSLVQQLHSEQNSITNIFHDDVSGNTINNYRWTIVA